MVQPDVADPTATTTNTEVATRSRTFDVQTLRGINTLDEALKAINDAGITVKDASEYIGDGFELLDDKDKTQLVGMPFVILEASEAPGDYGRTFVSIRAITKDARKVVINDGSHGIRDQIVDYMQEYETASGLFVAHGLRASRYKYCPECKEISKEDAASCNACGHSPLEPGATYYLDTSK